MFERDRLHRGPGITAMAAFASDVGRDLKVSRSTPTIELMVLISERASAPAATAARAGLTMFVMFGVSLTMMGMPRRLFHPAGDVLAIFGNLPYRRAHPALAHAMRATVVEFDGVRARVFDSLDDICPSLRL